MKNSKNATMLGILGGLGPMSTAYFYEMITEHTYAECDQEHIDIVISSRASTPDRTKFIKGEIKDNPVDIMIRDAQSLITFGADVIAIPCNTAHYFYDALQENVSVPIINIIYETVNYCKESNTKKIGILATDGTVLTNTYQNMCNHFGIEYAIPSKNKQSIVMDIIYGCVKKGQPVDMEAFNNVVEELHECGCEKIVLGCTELSLVKKNEGLGSYFIDALEVLTYKTILACNKKPVGFEEIENDLRKC